MELVKKADNLSIYKKRSGRYGVKNAQGKWINGDEKTKILSSEGLIKLSKAAEKPAEEATEEATEATEE